MLHQGARAGEGAARAALIGQRRLVAALLALALAFGGLAAFAPGQALADVRRADVVYGQTVDALGLSVAQCPSIDAERAIVMGADGTVYFERNADDEAQIASITKIMTALVTLDAVDAGIVSLDTQVSVSAAAAAVGESSAGLAQGDVMDLKTALYALLVPSGNDAAVALSETVGQALVDAGAASGATPEEAFVSQMNATAADLGCTDTVYENPHGLDFDEYAGNLHSTARDQAKVVQAAMRNDTFRSIVGGGSTTIQVTRGGAPAQIALQTTDGYFDISDDAIGVKTGFTDLAGASFAAAANRDGLELYAIVLHSSSESQRFYDADALCSWVYDHLQSYPLAHSDRTATYAGREVPVVAEVAHGDWTDVTVSATLADPDAAVNVFDLAGNVSQSVQFDAVHGDVRAGDKVGTITFKQRNEVIATQDLVACEDVAAPDFFEGVGVWWSRLLGNFTGAQAEAESYVVNTTPLIVDYTQAV